MPDTDYRPSQICGINLIAKISFCRLFLHPRSGNQNFTNITGDAEPETALSYHPSGTGTHLQQQLVSIKKTTTLSRVRVRPEPNTPILFLPFLPSVRPSNRSAPSLPARCLVAYLQTSSSFPFPKICGALCCAPLRSASKQER